MSAREGEESGAVTVMTIGFLVVIALLVVVVVNATAAYLQRQELANLSDGAALMAADGLDESAFYADREVRLGSDEAQDLVAEYVDGRDARVLDVVVTDDSVTVRLEADVDLPLTPPGWTDRTSVSAEATAQLRGAEGVPTDQLGGAGRR